MNHLMSRIAHRLEGPGHVNLAESDDSAERRIPANWQASFNR
jgi:hypothetical protein